MKKKTILFASLLLGGFSLMGTLPAAAAVRDTISINCGWQFHRGDVKNISELKSTQGGDDVVNLPHDFLIGQDWVAPDASERPDNSDAGSNVRSRLSPRGFKEMGIGWYRYELTPKAEWKGKRIVLDFQGIMLVGDVYLNGKRIGGTDYGYLGFDIDLSKLLKWGQVNEIIVKADTGKPNNSRWYTGGGLFRDVNLIVTDKNLYFPRHPLFIRTVNNKEIKIRANILNLQKTKKPQIPVEVKILNAEGKVVTLQKSELHFNAKWRDREYELPSISLEDAKLWSPDSPYLYNAEVTLYDNEGNIADQIRESFGIRTIEMNPEKGLLVNGKKVLLKGYANHHTLGALGAAAYPRAIEKRLKLMKEFGMNHIRTSHNPYSEDFLKLCDKYGILVVDELYDKWLTQYAGGRVEWESLWQKDIPEWVKRDRNHPSVILWSLGNELQQYSNLPFNDWGVTAYKLQKELLHRYDDTRLTTVAMHPRYRNLETDSIPADLAVATEVNSYNYRYMYFPGDMKRYPEKTFYQSEASVAAMGPNFYEMDRDKVLGLAYWGAIDYLGESMGWPIKGWNQGVFDLSLQPKPDAYFVKSMFTDEPTVHIGVIEKSGGNIQWNGINVSAGKLSENWNREAGEQVSLYTYTNGDEVELFLNGKSLGVKKNSNDPKLRARIKWDNIAYAPGTLVAVAKKNGKVVARHQIETTGEAVALKLIPDMETWHADGKDLMHVRIYAVDKKGRRVLNVKDAKAFDKLTFTVKGDANIVAVDNGNIASDELHIGKTQLEKTIQRHLFQGSALVILRAGDKPGKIELSVAGEKMKAKKLVLNTK
ncbi:glycoside hydrolase family 2 TIM barrel-domain containing protein [Segatella copri]|uniref:Glycoside hydrolase family 2 protein n=1 Tax=Segatella copri TaxID=165179 RepID=A0A414TWQ9_9BACT|nr:glycoside hydrolase family 2 TIM barrel-domain containing protein [Segatella copri]RHG36698.1 glycoside hydrolase family 2 protein [Segatella copri]RHG38593.1 glycoside hydrolase family 2 protein [Segatella copri]RHG68594.1 glycoside hydrolase family 2 protein [Segatella copri]